MSAQPRARRRPGLRGQFVRPCTSFSGNLCTGFGNEDTVCTTCLWDRFYHGMSDAKLRHAGFDIPEETAAYGTCPDCFNSMTSDQELLTGFATRHRHCPPHNIPDSIILGEN
jgi:hypothetical protein